METAQNNDRLTISQPQPKQSEILGWLVEQVTILAEAMGEAMTPARLKIYAGDLSDLNRPQLEVAFARARRELRFFPKIAELRELAGVAAKDRHNVEGEAGWKWANDYLRKWGVDLMPLWSNGKRIDAPAIPPRIEYALRRIGGLSGLNQITADSRPFMFRDFCEAYNLAPIADSLAPQLTDKFPISEGQVKQLSDGANELREIKPEVRMFPAKAVPQLLTDEQLRQRREMLAQQAAALRQGQRAQRSERMPNPPVESGNSPTLRRPAPMSASHA
jgi:hypothetical protein